MAAQFFYCPQCHKKTSTHLRLFDLLYDFSRGAAHECPVCGAVSELHISLDFQLGVGDGHFRVVNALLPDKLDSWLGEEEEEVTLYPFLVMLQGSEGKQFCWMPYWHVVGREARFGQHAICLDQSQFESLAAQAEEKFLVPA